MHDRILGLGWINSRTVALKTTMCPSVTADDDIYVIMAAHDTTESIKSDSNQSSMLVPGNLGSRLSIFTRAHLPAPLQRI